jgi:hypothetical protein
MMRSTRLRPGQSSTRFLGLPSDVHQSITLHLSGPKHFQQTLRLLLLMIRRWTLTKARILRAITQAVRKRTWLRQLTLQRTTDTVRCCLCPLRRLPFPRIMSTNSISNPRHTKMKLSCATILPTSMKSWSTNVLIARRLRATHRTPVTNWRRPESEGIRTESPPRAI